MADELADLPPPVVVKNGDFTLLLLELILEDAVADLLADLPPVVASSARMDFTFLLLEIIFADHLLADLSPSSGI